MNWWSVVQAYVGLATTNELARATTGTPNLNRDRIIVSPPSYHGSMVFHSSPQTLFKVSAYAVLPGVTLPRRYGALRR